MGYGSVHVLLSKNFIKFDQDKVLLELLDYSAQVDYGITNFTPNIESVSV